MPILNQPGDPARGGEIERGYEGVSEYSEATSAASLHEAILKAAEAAAPNRKPPPGEDTEIFEVSRIQIEVGNPNVKVYRVEISPAG